jgi:hypothetical protein
MSKWISVEDKLPELKQWVLVYGGGHYCVCMYDGMNCHWNHHLFLPYLMNKNITGITHWMALPDAPV